MSPLARRALATFSTCSRSHRSSFWAVWRSRQGARRSGKKGSIARAFRRSAVEMRGMSSADACWCLELDVTSAKIGSTRSVELRVDDSTCNTIKQYPPEHTWFDAKRKHWVFDWTAVTVTRDYDCNVDSRIRILGASNTGAAICWKYSLQPIIDHGKLENLLPILSDGSNATVPR